MPKNDIGFIGHLYKDKCPTNPIYFAEEPNIVLERERAKEDESGRTSLGERAWEEEPGRRNNPVSSSLQELLAPVTHASSTRKSHGSFSIITIARWKGALRAHKIFMWQKDELNGFFNEDEARRFVSQSAQSMCFSYED